MRRKIKLGFKCGCLFVGSIDDGYFSTAPVHKPKLAASIYKVLRGASNVSGAPHHFDIYPDEGSLVIGAYEKGAYIADRRFIDLLEREEYKLFEAVAALYETKDYLALGLHSVVNFAAFAYCKNGVMKRSFACCADDGIMHQSGERLPEEDKQYENSVERDGEIVFLYTNLNGLSEDMPIDCVAEEMVFDLVARPLGCRMDVAEEEILQTEVFLPIAKGKSSSQQKPIEKPFWKFW